MEFSRYESVLPSIDKEKEWSYTSFYNTAFETSTGRSIDRYVQTMRSLGESQKAEEMVIDKLIKKEEKNQEDPI